VGFQELLLRGWANKRRTLVRTRVGVEKVTVIGGGMAGKTW